MYPLAELILSVFAPVAAFQYEVPPVAEPSLNMVPPAEVAKGELPGKSTVRP
jgi:hypothetical protein